MKTKSRKSTYTVAIIADFITLVDKVTLCLHMIDFNKGHVIRCISNLIYL